MKYIYHYHAIHQPHVGSVTPFSPPSGPAQRLFQGPPAESKFLAVSLISDPETPEPERQSLKRILAMQRAWRVGA